MCIRFRFVMIMMKFVLATYPAGSRDKATTPRPSNPYLMRTNACEVLVVLAPKEKTKIEN
jgi:hypothetical protein